MHTPTTFLFTMALALALSACGPQQSASPPPADPAHNSRNALDWAGSYEGVTPCADCPGIQMRLTLMDGERYELSTLYLERQRAPDTVQGQFEWDADGNAITLDAAGHGQRFQVGEGRLLLLNLDGSAVSWDTPYRVLSLQIGDSIMQASSSAGITEAPPEQVLQDHAWTLDSASAADGEELEALLPAGHRFVLHFDAERLSIQGGCNAMNGEWWLDAAGQLGTGQLMSTKKACEAALMDADQALAGMLSQPLAVAIMPGAKPVLTLTSPDQDVLLFDGQATPQSLYGEPERIFLEVAAQTVPCTSGELETRCLQVRERRYDEQGLRIDPPGEWEVFHGSIDGYTHEDGVRKVLRINRYTRQDVPADASRHVDVLDLVVEAEVVSE